MNLLLVAGEVHGLDTADLLAGGSGNGLDGNGGADSAGSSHEGTALDGGSGQLAGQGAESLGAVAGGHCDGVLGGDLGLMGREGKKDGREEERSDGKRGIGF